MDSLLHELSNPKKNTDKVNILFEIAGMYYKTNPDTAYYYLQKSHNLVFKYKQPKIISRYYYLMARILSEKEIFDKAITYCDSCILFAKGDSLEMQSARCLSAKSICYYYTGDNFSGIQTILKTIPIYKKADDISSLSNAYTNIANFYQRSNNYTQALEYFNKAIAITDTIKNPGTASSNYLNLGVYFEKLGKYKNTLEAYFKSLRYAERAGVSTCLILTDIGNTYTNLSNYKEAEKYLNLAVNEVKQNNSTKTEALQTYQALAVFYQNQNEFEKSEEPLKNALRYIDLKNSPFVASNIFNTYSWTKAELGEYDDAIKFAQKAVSIRKELKDFNGLAESYDYYAYVFQKKGDLKNAYKYYKIGLQIADSINNFIFKKNYYASLSNLLVEMNDYKNAFSYLKLYLNLSDSMNNENVSRATAEVQAIYETEKKQQMIELLNKDKLLHEVQLKEKNQQRNMLLVGFGFLCLVLCLVFIGLMQKRKANNLLSEKNKLISQQKLLVEEHQKEILDSIHYAKRIQYTLLAHEDFVNDNILNNFILFKPKDIVSGDFYWATKHEDKFFIAVCDSTGHGVPGAFMSLLNIGFLSEAINEKNIFEPNNVFNFVRERLINSISKEGQKDGFDGILVCIDKTKNEITYAAANNAPILISNNEIIELEKDRMPVGKGERTEEFKLHTIKVKPNDTLYLYTDGYADQFGGPKGKKFKYKALNELLLSISSDNMDSQKEKLNSTIENWKGDLEQVDDVCVIGIKF